MKWLTSEWKNRFQVFSPFAILFLGLSLEAWFGTSSWWIWFPCLLLIITAMIPWGPMRKVNRFKEYENEIRDASDILEEPSSTDNQRWIAISDIKRICDEFQIPYPSDSYGADSQPWANFTAWLIAAVSRGEIKRAQQIMSTVGFN